LKLKKEQCLHVDIDTKEEKIKHKSIKYL